MKVLESKQCAYGIKKLIQTSKGYKVRIVRLEENLKNIKAFREFNYSTFGDAFLRYNDGDYSMVRKYSRPITTKAV